MTDVIIIEKSGNIFKKTTNNIDKIWTLCNYRNNNNFILIHEFKHENYSYEIFGKEKGRNGSENYFQTNLLKNKVYYGNFCCLKKINNKIVNVNLDEFNILINGLKNIISKQKPDCELEEEPYL